MSDHAQSTHANQPGHNDSGHGEAHAHGGSIKTYLAVFVALCVLTTGSFMTWTQWWQDIFSSHVGWAFMMAISCTKALLVILFFMHLKYEANWKYVLTIPAGFMSIFLALMLVPDIGMRFWHYSRDRLEFTAVPEKAESSHEAHNSPMATPPADAAAHEKAAPHP